MKASFSAAAVLLAASAVVASPITTASQINGIIYPTVEGRDAYALSPRAVCNADNVLRDLRNPAVSASASAFCSAYLQSTSTVTATTVIAQTSTVPITDTVTVTSTVIEPGVTVLCPASPTATVTTCNYPAYGFGAYLISSNPNVDPYACHQSCLEDPNCQSFQVQDGGAQFCNLFNEPTSGFTQYAPGGGFTFFDRDCTQYTAGACGTPVAKVKRDPAPVLPNPTYIPATVPPSRVSSACSCFITSPSAPATQTVFVPQTSVTDVTTTLFETDTVFQTVTDSTVTAAVTAPP